MKKALFSKVTEALLSVLPVSLIVILIYFTPLVSLTPLELTVFLVATLVLVLGIALFNLGADMAMTPMGEHIGSGLTHLGSLPLLLFVCFIMGLFITIAEPDLTVLASQLEAVINPTLLVVTVGLGVGLFLLISVLKMIFKKELSSILMFFYMFLFALSALIIVNGNESFLPTAFDSGGVTTGPITVPFIMAMGVGIASTLGGKNASENSFGLVAMCSIGPILAVAILGLTVNGEIAYTLPDYSVESGLGTAIFSRILAVAEEVAIALGLIILFFIVLQIFCLKLPKKTLLRITVGIIYTYLGLVLFLSAANIGYMPVGFKLGQELSKNTWLLIVSGFIIGFVVVLAEPAVHVLNKQVEEITGGSVSKRSMMLALSIGVGISIGLSMIRINFGFSILYYLIPGYFLSLGLSFFVPGIYTAIAFDSGGVASGPLTSTFILPLAIGACAALGGEGSILSDAFGVVAMVAMTPLITIQLLGFRAVMANHIKERIAMRRMTDADDEQIIEFI